MSEGLPTVSVIIPHYNMHASLPDAIESVANQDYPNVELIVVDDGSEIRVDNNQFSVSEVDFALLEIEHGGKAKAVNRGFQEASGKYLTILDADDQLPVDSLSKRLEVFKKGRADLSIGSFEVCYNQEVKKVRKIDTFVDQSPAELEKALLKNIISPFHQNAMLFSKELLGRTGGMDPQMLRSQDKDFAIRLLRKSRGISFIKKSVYRYSRYERPLSKRLYNRLFGMKYKRMVIARYSKGWRRVLYWSWATLVGVAKFIHDLFGVYKK